MFSWQPAIRPRMSVRSVASTRRASACAFRLREAASLARPATPGRAGSGPREVCADYDAIGHVLLAVLCQVRSSSKR